MPEAPLPPLPPAGQPPWRTWLDDLARRLPVSRAAVVVTAVAVGLVGLGVLLLRPARPVDVATLPMATPAPAEPTESSGSTKPGTSRDPVAPDEVVVDVTGAVARPGLVRLRAGSRVADAVAAAGGPAADAALVDLNQARVVADGEQVRVPRVGEPPPPVTATVPAPAGSAATAPAAPVDLNRATAAELDGLPGVGPSTAAAIITWRQENGGFRRVDDLLEVPGIGAAKLERLRPHVRV